MITKKSKNKKEKKYEKNSNEKLLGDSFIELPMGRRFKSSKPM